jgi:very-short-patch-repair endonuclease
MSSFEILTHINNIPIRKNFIKNLPYNGLLKKLAKEKRKGGILSEVLFWMHVRNFTFHEIDFDRQRIIGNFIVDFYVKSLGLVVEIDGSSHDQNQEYDKARQQFLENFGIHVFRCTDYDVKNNIGIVMESLEDFIIKFYGV